MRPRWLSAGTLGALFLMLYGATLTDWHSGDDLQWAMQVEDAVKGRRGVHPSSADSIIDPHWTAPPTIPQARYLLELPTSATIFRAARRAGLSHKAYRPVQWAHAVAGVAGIVFFYVALAPLAPGLSSVIPTVGLGVSYAWWYYSIHLDYTITSHALACAMLLVLTVLFRTGDTHGRKMWAVVLGAANALVALYLLTGALLVPVILFGAWRRFGASGARPVALRYLAGCAGAVVLLGGAAWLASTGSLPSLARLMGQVTYSSAFVHDVSLTDLPKALYGAAKSLVTFPGLAEIDPSQLLAANGTGLRLVFFGWHVVLMAMVLLPFVALWLLRHRSHAAGELVAVLVGWWLVHLPFAIYWEPTYVKWWTGALVPWWALVALLLAAVRDRPWFRHAALAAGAWVTLLFALNLFAKFLPNATQGGARLAAVAALRETTEPGDLFVSTSNGNLLDFYLPYFGERRTLSSYLVHLQNGRDAAAATRILSQAAATVIARGDSVYVYDCAEPMQAAQTPWLVERASLARRWTFAEWGSICELQFPGRMRATRAP